MKRKNNQLIKTYSKWNPLHSKPIHCNHEKVFIDTEGIGHFDSRIWEPASELLDCGMHYLLRFDLSGVKKNTLTVQYNNNWVIVSGNKDLPITNGYLCYTEFYYGQFKKEVPVPIDVSKDVIQATITDGILTVQLNKINPEEWIDVQIHS